MPGTVQELASMFRRAIDSQGNVLDMGVVKEVVTALERSPVSAKDLKDLKSTRLGKYINQVRRAIPDKSLAKRMKTLVIQWRSLAQQSPTTPNGVPSQTTPSPFSTTTPSPASPGTLHTAQPSTNTSAVPATHLPGNQQTTSSQSPPPLPALPRPSSANPAANRKRALHRLSKFPPQHPPQKSSLSTSSLSTSSQSTHHNSPSPTPPLASSHTPSPAPLSSNSSNKPPSLHPTPSGKTLSVTKPVRFRDSSAGSEAQTTLPSSLQVRYPLQSVVGSLVVRIPLSSVSVSRPPVATSEPPPRISSASTTGSEERQTAPRPVGSQVGHTNSLPSSTAERSRLAPEAVGSGKIPPPPPPPSSQTPDREPQRQRTVEQLCLVVSVNRDLLRQRTSLSVNLSSTFSKQDTPTSDTITDKSHTHRDTKVIQSTLPKLTQMTDDPAWGGRGADGIWRRWTEPIIHEDSFAVNILPYVYVDGMEESEDEGL